MDLFDDLPEPVNSGNAGEKAGEICVKREGDEEDQQSKRLRAESERLMKRRRVKLKGYAAERKGEREGMEDAHVIIDQFTRSHVNQVHPLQSALTFYGVFDGHAGAKASTYAAAHLHLNFASTFNKVCETGVDVEKEISKIFVEAFKKTDEDFLKEATKQKPAWKDGSTALTVVSIDEVVFIANLGDSKAVLCRYNEEQKRHVAVPLSKDHSPIQYEERMRIQKMGGHVREGRVMGVLEVSRSIGDGQYKTLGVTCIPDVRRCQLTDHDRFIIMGCDGLWKVFSPESSIEFVLGVEEEEVRQSEEVAAVESELRYETAANRLCSEAVRRGSGDNVTVIIIHINYSH